MAQSKSSPGTTAPGHADRVPWLSAATPAGPRPSLRLAPMLRGAVVVAPGPGRSVAGGCTGSLWLPRAHGGLAVRHRHQGRGHCGERRVPRQGRVSASGPGEGHAAVSGGHGWGSRPCRVPAAPGTHREAVRCWRAVPGPGEPHALPPGPRRRGRRQLPKPTRRGGSLSPGGSGPCIGPQQPNKGLQATANSVRSCLAPALRRA